MCTRLRWVWRWVGGSGRGPARPFGLCPSVEGGLWRFGLALAWRGRTVVSTCSVSLDRVVRSVSASEQSDESGAYPSIRRPPSPSMPKPDSRPGTRHQPSNLANYRLMAPGPHRGSRGTYGVVPRPEGSGEDGVLPGKQGVFGGWNPPLMHQQSAWRQPRQRTLCSVGGAHSCAGTRPLKGEDQSRRGPLRPFGPPPPEGGGRRRSHLKSSGWRDAVATCAGKRPLKGEVAAQRSEGALRTASPGG